MPIPGQYPVVMLKRGDVVRYLAREWRVLKWEAPAPHKIKVKMVNINGNTTEVNFSSKADIEIINRPDTILS